VETFSYLRGLECWPRTAHDAGQLAQAQNSVGDSRDGESVISHGCPSGEPIPRCCCKNLLTRAGPHKRSAVYRPPQLPSVEISHNSSTQFAIISASPVALSELLPPKDPKGQKTVEVCHEDLSHFA
jgi:hypothetical protein